MRYALFAGNDYYPSGGMNDLQNTSENLNELLDIAIEPQYYDWDKNKTHPNTYHWWHIVDLTTMEIVRNSND